MLYQLQQTNGIVFTKWLHSLVCDPRCFGGWSAYLYMVYPCEHGLTWLVCVRPVLVLSLMTRARAVNFSEPGRLGEKAAGDQVTRHYKSSTANMEYLNSLFDRVQFSLLP